MSRVEPYLKTNEVIGERYKVVKQISKTYREVFICVDTHNNDEEVVVKLEKMCTNTSFLINESQLYEILKTSASFPLFLNHFNDKYYRYIVMKKMGDNLQTYFNDFRKKSGQIHLDLKTVCKFADQMLSRLTNCHLRNIIHRDIKPENFVFDLKDKNLLFLIDFNLAKEYRNRNLVHIRHVVKDAMYSVGNVQFLSMNAHNGEEQSRRDDLLSMGYSFIYLAKGCLPWSHISYKDYTTRAQHLEAVKSVKQNTSIDVLCYGLPKQFPQFMTLCEKLDFYETPNYWDLRFLFKTLLKELSSPSSMPHMMSTTAENRSQTIQRTRDYSPDMKCP